MAEKLDRINKSLRDEYGVDTSTGREMYRVSFADDQFEKRLTKFTDSGIELLHAEVREMPKYRGWLDGLYVLEHLCVVPVPNMGTLPTQKLSYEPLFPFKDAFGNPLPPNFQVAKIVIDGVLAAKGKGTLAKYAKAPDDPNAPITSQQEFYEHRKKEIDEMVNAAFGDESGLQQALVSGEGIAVPSNYTRGSN